MDKQEKQTVRVTFSSLLQQSPAYRDDLIRTWISFIVDEGKILVIVHGDEYKFTEVNSLLGFLKEKEIDISSFVKK